MRLLTDYSALRRGQPVDSAERPFFEVGAAVAQVPGAPAPAPSPPPGKVFGANNLPPPPPPLLPPSPEGQARRNTAGTITRTNTTHSGLYSCVGDTLLAYLNRKCPSNSSVSFCSCAQSPAGKKGTASAVAPAPAKKQADPPAARKSTPADGRREAPKAELGYGYSVYPAYSCVSAHTLFAV